MHKSCAPVFLTAIVVRCNSWVFPSMEEHFLSLQMENTWRFLMLNAPTQVLQVLGNHCLQPQATPLWCSANKYTLPGLSDPAGSTSDYLLWPHITKHQQMELIHPEINTLSTLAITVWVDVMIANIRGLFAASAGVGSLCVSLVNKLRSHRKSLVCSSSYTHTRREKQLSLFTDKMFEIITVITPCTGLIGRGE